MQIKFYSTSMLTHNNLQRINVEYYTEKALHLNALIIDGDKVIEKNIILHFESGNGTTYFFINPINEDKNLTVKLFSNGIEVYKTVFDYKKPFKRTIYTMISSHTDIGLHNSQYIQRKNCITFVDKAAELIDYTSSRDENDKYRYTIEGTWVWNNYAAEKGIDAAKSMVEKYIKNGDIGVCASVAGNHTQVFGLEEMCRSAYEKRRLFDSFNIKSETMAMIDNNGISMSIIGPYTQAGYKNIIFSPNHWNPIPSTLWNTDTTKNGYMWNSDAGGGGSRIDIRYASETPMVFFWEDKNKNRLLVWGAPEYGHGSAAFGFYPEGVKPICEVEDAMAKQLPIIDKKYPYEVWLNVCYYDDQTPNLDLTNTIKEWNSKWQWPKVRTLGNPDEFFNLLREKHTDKIPVLCGDITGGWYQHPLSAAELLAEKFTVDRSLPTAEKWSVIASLLNDDYEYPFEDFSHAWDCLLYNDEHSYGVSGYKGRRVYETWMQHKDWIEKAKTTAKLETKNALESIAKNINSDDESYVIFNPTLLERQELIERKEGFAKVTVPPLGYCAISKSELKPHKSIFVELKKPPNIENKFYKVKFFENGSIKSIFDKEQNQELLDLNNKYHLNEFVYTKDNHKTFLVLKATSFYLEKFDEKTVVIAEGFDQNLNSKIIQKTTLFNNEKRIDFDNQIFGVKDMINDNRYNRFLYSAFPFKVDNAKRLCHLNGAVAEYGKDITGHGTDVYMAANEWCCCENNDFGIGLVMLDSSLVEFGEIHRDKTDYGNLKDGSQMFLYLANDWLQMHCVGGSHLNYRFRFSLTSYKGDYKTAKLSKFAERIINPVTIVEIGAQDGKLNEKSLSFINVNTNLRLLTLKAADDSDGIIARFYGNDKPVENFNFMGKPLNFIRNTVDEKLYEGEENNNFITYRIGKDNIKLKLKENYTPKPNNKKPLPIGQFYTGLITKPKAACGENDGQLYLLWGANKEDNLSHYKLFRGETVDFVANASTYVADILPEEYVVGRYVDTGLKTHTEYFYRVCAVNKDGVCGELSDVFSAITREKV